MEPRPKLDEKTQLLVALGAAVAARCQRCFAKLHGRSRALGVTDDEVRAVVALAAQVSAHAHEFMLVFVDETVKGAAGRDAARAPAGNAGRDERGCC